MHQGTSKHFVASIDHLHPSLPNFKSTASIQLNSNPFCLFFIAKETNQFLLQIHYNKEHIKTETIITC